MPTFRLALFALLAVCLAACDSGVPEASSFSATVSGDVERTLTGPAGLSDGNGIREIHIEITLVEGGMGVRGITILDHALRPVVEGRGTYPFGGSLSLVYQDEGTVYTDRSGTLTLTRLGDDYAAGSFSATLESETGATVEVEGSFEALANENILY